MSLVSTTCVSYPNGAEGNDRTLYRIQMDDVTVRTSDAKLRTAARRQHIRRLICKSYMSTLNFLQCLD